MGGCLVGIASIATGSLADAGTDDTALGHAKPRIGEGTLADHSKAAVILVPWSSHTYDRATGKLLTGEALHGVIVVCGVRGGKPRLARGVLT